MKDDKRDAQIRFLESLEVIDREIRRSSDLEALLQNLMQATLEIFKCDRAWLLYPCNPKEPTFRVPMEASTPEFPGAFELNVEVPMYEGAAEVCAIGLEEDGPVDYERLVYPELTRDFGVLSQMVLAVYPRVGDAWLFGMHQCSHARVWSTEDKRLFQEVGRRVADGLTSALILRDLKESEERYRSVVGNSPGAVYRCENDVHWTMQFISNAIEKVSGYPADDFIGNHIRSYASIIHDEDVQMVSDTVSKALSKSEQFALEYRIIHADGSVRWVYEQGRGITKEDGSFRFLDGVILDISDVKRAEAEKEKLEIQLRHSQKMEAIGLLAGGIAHDFNNVLTSILGNIDIGMIMLKKKSMERGSLLDCLSEIEKSSERASVLTRQLLAFSRRQVSQPKVLDLNETVFGMKNMIRVLLTEDIDLRIDLAKNLERLRADANQLEQVVLNLVINARDAMKGGGQLRIKTGNRTLIEPLVTSHFEAAPGHYVALSVEDSGVGMDEEIVERVFEPFFTTKEAGQGTGLGLATVYGIVSQARGYITVESTVGKGSTFEILLPVVEEELQPIDEETSEWAPVTGTETILFCEDEESVRNVTTSFLRDAGYSVLPAVNGQQALRMAKSYAGAIDLLITDVIMPCMNGKELADFLVDLRPGIEVLYVSGYTADIIAHHGVLDEGVEFLEKPFGKKKLLKRVRKILDKNAS